LGSYSLLTSNENVQYVGGAELMQVLVGNELAKKGYDISFITLNEKGETKKDFEKITIIKTYSPNKNINDFKKARVLWQTLRKCNSEIYIQSGGVPGIIALYCFLLRKKYIKWMASDRNVLLKGIEKTSLYTKISHYLDIKLAYLIIAQNNFQKQTIEKKFHKQCLIIKNPIPIPNNAVSTEDNTERENNVLWVGTIRSIKQPEVYLRIAQMLPMYKFKMIGGRDDIHPEFYDIIQKQAKEIPNLEFIGFIPYNKIKKYYREACVFVNTSLAEGFPNTFLEAGINYRPIVSLHVDPDEIICNNQLGFHSKSVEQMIIDIDTLMKNSSLRSEMGKNARKYIEGNHDLHKIVDQFEKLLSSI
jgi:glycosyltransferase involved in cell wall biosynthesis